MSDANKRFAECVTSASFHLTLSKPQIDALSFLDHSGWSWGVTTAMALRRKGLVDFDTVTQYNKEAGTFDHVEGLRLTDAGKAVIPLLKLSGQYRHLMKVDEEIAPEINISVKMREKLKEDEP